MVTIDTPACRECGDLLAADAPRGLCPRCLMNAGLADSTVDDTQFERAVV